MSQDAVRNLPAMQTVIVDPPAEVLAERKRLGLDLFDEVWDGEYHMVPAPMDEHQRINLELTVLLHPVVRTAGLNLRFESNLLVSEEIGFDDFRVPDLVIFPNESAGVAGVIGAASLVVEIRSPGDESFAKLPFYERLGVAEVLIIDRDTKVVRHWINGDHGLVESAGTGEGRHHLRCLPVSLQTDATTAQLTVSTEHGSTTI